MPTHKDRNTGVLESWNIGNQKGGCIFIFFIGPSLCRTPIPIVPTIHRSNFPWNANEICERLLHPSKNLLTRYTSR